MAFTQCLLEIDMDILELFAVFLVLTYIWSTFLKAATLVSTKTKKKQQQQQKKEGEKMTTDVHTADKTEQFEQPAQPVEDVQGRETKAEEMEQKEQPPVEEENKENGVPTAQKTEQTAMQGYYAQLLANPYFQQVVDTYQRTKHSNGFLENTLVKVENQVAATATAATEKAYAVHDRVVVQPTQAVANAYNSGMEKTKWAVETGKNAAVTGTTLGIGATVVAAQLTLSLSAWSAGLVIDSLGASQRAGSKVVSSVRETEQAVEKRIWAVISEGQRLAKIPVDKLSESANSFLDVCCVVVERTLGISVDDQSADGVTARVKIIAHAVAKQLTDKANQDVISPCRDKMRSLIDQLSQSFVIMDLVRQRREWAAGKVEEAQQHVMQLKDKLEAEAKQYRMSPEEMLMKSIRKSSNQLSDSLVSLKQKGNEMFGDGTRVESAISYLQQLEANLAEADDIYGVRDEVITEARQRLSELSAWTSSLLARETSQA